MTEMSMSTSSRSLDHPATDFTVSRAGVFADACGVVFLAVAAVAYVGDGGRSVAFSQIGRLH